MPVTDEQLGVPRFVRNSASENVVQLFGNEFSHPVACEDLSIGYNTPSQYEISIKSTNTKLRYSPVQKSVAFQRG